MQYWEMNILNLLIYAWKGYKKAMNIGSEITAETLSHYGGFNNSDAYRNIRNFTENNIYENWFQFIKLQL